MASASHLVDMTDLPEEDDDEVRLSMDGNAADPIRLDLRDDDIIVATGQ